ncbi:MAG: arginase family protein [Candidatus Helarchaeota archaeon]
MVKPKRIKVFGAALDPADSETKIAMKQAHLQMFFSRQTPKSKYKDPYEAFITESKVLSSESFEKIGRFPIESWLTPKPVIEDSIFMTPLDFRIFLDDNGCKEYADQLEKFVIQKILPDIPLMIGADHSLTGGVISALTKKYGIENLTILIFDGHFDAIPTNFRIGLASYSKDHKDEIAIPFPEMIDSVEDSTQVPLTYNCGTFLYHLLEQGTILPENLIVYGVMDYPGAELRKIADQRVKNFVDFYLDYEKKGVQIIPNYKDDTKSINHLQKALNSIHTPYLYLSIDVDVASLNAVLAARFMEFIGIGEECLQDAIRSVSSLIHSDNIELIGLDFMEIETYFLNAKLKSGKIDKTLKIIDSILEILF